MSGTVSQTISHYRVVDKIGADGMGVAYFAQDEQLDRGRAESPPDRHASRRRSASSSVRKALALNHPNIETVHEFATYAPPNSTTAMR